mmetsp:Transcript_18650/g.24020  ORF Transcript_18650/g.24020 Transcript_18650/m.24020 type:complete len:105 (+) Transcript_18650:101-415(+)
MEVDGIQASVEEAGKGLTGRAKRAAKLKAMIESLDQTLSYQRPPADNNVQPSVDHASISAVGSLSNNQDSVELQKARKHKLPVSDMLRLVQYSSECVVVDATVQ